MKLKDKIENWFEQKLGGSLLLPDGWYGRPYQVITFSGEGSCEVKETKS